MYKRYYNGGMLLELKPTLGVERTQPRIALPELKTIIRAPRIELVANPDGPGEINAAYWSLECTDPKRADFWSYENVTDLYYIYKGFYESTDCYDDDHPRQVIEAVGRAIDQWISSSESHGIVLDIMAWNSYETSKERAESATSQPSVANGSVYSAKWVGINWDMEPAEIIRKVEVILGFKEGTITKDWCSAIHLSALTENRPYVLYPAWRPIRTIPDDLLLSLDEYSLKTITDPRIRARYLKLQGKSLRKEAPDVIAAYYGIEVLGAIWKGYTTPPIIGEKTLRTAKGIYVDDGICECPTKPEHTIAEHAAAMKLVVRCSEEQWQRLAEEGVQNKFIREEEVRS